MTNIQTIIGDKRLDESKKKYLKKNAIYSIANMILWTFYMKNLDINTIESFLFALSIVLVLYPVLGTLLGLIIAIFPYKELSFSLKYLRSALLGLLIINIITTLCLFLGFMYFMFIFRN